MKITVTQGDVELDSPEEALFYGLCRLWDIPVECTPPSRDLSDGTGGWWSPGFRVVFPHRLEIWVEVADGQHDAVLRPLRDTWRVTLGRRLAVLYREELHVLMTRANAHAVREQIKIWAR